MYVSEMSMASDLTTNQAFDDYAARFGWVYDNGGRYRGEYWEYYFRKDSDLHLLRQGPDRIAVVRFGSSPPTEVWSGRIATSDDFDQLMARLSAA
jgi:hypothetical protein